MSELLLTEEQELFTTPGRFTERHLMQMKAVNQHSSQQPKPLAKTVLDDLKVLHKRTTSWFKALYVLVEEGDGMSWSAARVCQIIQEAYPALKPVILVGRASVDNTPSIARLIGDKALLKIARKTGLIRSGSSKRTLVSTLVVMMAIMIGVITEAVRLAIASPDPMPLAELLRTALLNPTFILSAALVVVLGLIGQYLIGMTGKGEDAPSMPFKHLEDLHTTTEYAKLREALAQRLAIRDFPRFVVVDGFSRLDPLTQAAIDRYFQEFAELRRGSEMWIVFDEKGLDEFGKRSAQSATGFGYFRCEKYRQILLTEIERRELAAKAGYPDRADYVTAKAICRPQSGFDQAFATFFDDYRKEHKRDENRYGDADLFFLLALTSLNGNPSLSQGFLISNLSAKDRLRSEVLKLFLRGSEARRGELRVHFAEMERNFKRFLLVAGEGDTRTLNVMPEAAAAMIAHEGRFGLPEREIGHLFWALFWYDKLRSHPLQSFWIRKLAFHISEARLATTLARPLPEGVASTLFDAVLFTIRGSLQTCLLAAIPGLLEDGLAILEREDLQRDRRRAEALAALGWNAFAVWGNDRLLGYILELQALRRSEEEEATKAPSFDPLVELFLACLSVGPDRRELLRRELGHLEGEVGEVILDYARVRSTWLVLSVAALNGEALPSLRLLQAARQARLALPEILERTLGRMQTENRPILPATELLVISIGAWCLTWLLHRPALGILPGALVQALSALGSPGALANALGFIPLPKILEIMEDVLLLASETHQGGKIGHVTPFGVDFLRRAFVQEMAVVALAGAWTVSSVLEEEGRSDSPEGKKVQDLLEFGRDLLKIKPTQEAEASRAFFEALERGMSLPGLVWSKLELSQLEDLATVRRLQFESANQRAAGYLEYRTRLEILGDILESRSYAGLLANLVLAESMKASSEMSAHFVCQAAALAVVGDLGEDLAGELCLIALSKAHVYHFDLRTLFQFLLGVDAEGRTRLARALSTLTDGEIPSVCLWLNNCFTHARVSDLGTAALSDLFQRVSAIQDADARAEAQAVLDYFALDMKVDRGEAVDWLRVHQDWGPRRTSWLYPSVLKKQIETGQFQECLPEALAVLREASHPVAGSSYVHLALAMGHELYAQRSNPTGLDLVLSFLRQAMEQWESQLSVESNSEIFGFLYEVDSQRQEEYLERVLKWKTIRLQRDELRKLPEMFHQGSYFMIFSHYFTATVFWGLSTEINEADRLRSMRLDRDRRRQLALEWKGKGGKVPKAFLVSQSQLVVSSDFLRQGNILFSPPNDLDPELEEDRRRFDEVADGAIPKLFDMVMNLPGLPAPIREIIQGHSDRLLHYTIPA